MTKKVLLTDRWNEYLGRFKNGESDVYFTEEYVKLCANDKDTTVCFVYDEGDKVFLFPFLKRKVALLKGEYFDFETPYGYGGPLANTDDASFIGRAYESFSTVARDSGMIGGFIRFHPMIGNHSLLDGRADVTFDRKTVAMDLGVAEEDIWKAMDPSHRNNIKKAGETGLEFSVDERLEHIDSFKKLYRYTMNRLDAEEFYYFSEDYFEKIRDLRDHVFLGIVSFNERIIAATLFLRYGEYSHAHLTGSLVGYRPYNPNEFMYYRTAMFLKGRGVKSFNLGGGTNGSADNSLYRYKRQFSSCEYPFYRGMCVFDDGKYKEACDLWAESFPEKKGRYGKYCLRYRY